MPSSNHAARRCIIWPVQHRADEQHTYAQLTLTLLAYAQLRCHPVWGGGTMRGGAGAKGRGRPR